MQEFRDQERRKVVERRRQILGFVIICPTLILLLLNFHHVHRIKGATTFVESKPDRELFNSSLISANHAGKKRVAYAITVTKDGPFLDGALVLGYAAQKVHDSSKGFNSIYEADLVAFVAPGVVKARPILEKHGWLILEKGLPVELEDIENQDYVQQMRKSGCCGASEFLKLWAYTLTDYERVIHLDMDSIIFKNMVTDFSFCTSW
jgi:hypothetical protein